MWRNWPIGPCLCVPQAAIWDCGISVTLVPYCCLWTRTAGSVSPYYTSPGWTEYTIPTLHYKHQYNSNIYETCHVPISDGKMDTFICGIAYTSHTELELLYNKQGWLKYSRSNICPLQTNGSQRHIIEEWIFSGLPIWIVYQVFQSFEVMTGGCNSYNLHTSQAMYVSYLLSYLGRAETQPLPCPPWWSYLWELGTLGTGKLNDFSVNW